jgi:preprotein translocase subunit SecF
MAAIIALFHDLVFVIGVFSVMGHFLGTKIDSLFLTALLTVLGFSVHDTIVVFDRIRERLKIGEEKTFEEVVNVSVNQTIVRSIATSMTVIFVLLTLLLFGGESIRSFVIALLAGMFIGTYSSIFVASPLLVSWYKFRSK